MDESSLAFSHVYFGYAKAPVLQDTDFVISPGRLTAICGPNGSGKSTLFGLAAGSLAPSRGRVTLAGQPVRDIPPKQRARRMAILPQSPEAPPELLVRDLVALGRFAHRRPLSGLRDADHAAINAGLAATKIEDLADRPLAALSGGQRQRAWIAMILAQEAPLILLDEPTNHLDITHAVETLELLQNLVQRDGKTVVVILHDINLMTAFADDVVLLGSQRDAVAGAFETVVSEASLTGLYGRPCVFGHLPNRARPFVVVQ